VAAALFEDDAGARRRIGRLLPQLQHLDAVFRALLKARRGRGAIEFDVPEVTFAFDRQGRIARVIPRHRNDAHRIIEECMIAANVEAAKFLKTHRLPTLYRVHAGPAEESLEELAIFLEAYGIRLRHRHKITPADYNAVVMQIKGRPDEALIETVMLRSLKQAVYQPENIGHFGLALPEYAHFTSPIRRYPDLLVHRGIRHLLRGGPPGAFDHDRGEMERLGQQCSAAERRADEATREALDWLKCEFMADKIGEEFDAIVTGVMDFGLFVQIPEFQIEGLVHVSALGADYFRRDPVHRRLEGDRTGASWQLSDRVRVRVAAVNLEERKIDFDLAVPPAGGQRSGRRRRRRS
jgi:ribonuclease R